MSTDWDGIGGYAPPEGFRRHIKVLAGDEIEKLVEGYRSGKTVYELGREFGIHRTTVGIILRRQGLAPVRRSACEQHRDEIMRLRNEGVSYRRIGERYGLSDTAIRDFVMRG